MKLSKVDFTGREVSPPFTTQLNKWHKVKCVHYKSDNDYRFRGTVDGKVILDVKNLVPHNYEHMKLKSQSITPIGNLQKIRIAGMFRIIVYAEYFNFYLELESVCFKLTSSPDDICGKDKNKYNGDQIHILKNGVPVSNIPPSFPHFHECFGWIKDDIFEFKAQSGDGVSYRNFKVNSTKVVFKICITSFFVNDKQLLFGKFSRLKFFWLDADPDVCRLDAMSTSNLKIKNGEVIEPQCMTNTDTNIASASDENIGDGSLINMNNYKCTDQWIQNDNRKIAQTFVSHSQQFSTHEEAKTACMELPIDDCASIEEERRVNDGSIVFNLKRLSLKMQTSNRHTTYIRPICRSDG